MRTFAFIIVSLALAISAFPFEPVVLERGPHHRVVQTVDELTDATGAISFRTNVVTELATGMHMWSETETNWVTADATIAIENGRGHVRRAQHNASFSGNANDPQGLVDLRLPNGQRVRIRTLGIAYTDPDTGDTAFIAQIKDSEGQTDGANTIIYADSFTGLRADIRVRSFLNGIENDIILREQPPSPESVGISSAKARLEVIHEILQSPQPAFRHANIRRQDGRMDVDTTIDFGGMRVPLGNAFTLPAGTLSSNPEPLAGAILVTKEHFEIGGRRFFAEAIPYTEAAPLLEDLLPERQGAFVPPKMNDSTLRQTADAKRRLPEGFLNAPEAASARSLALATGAPRYEPGLVIDYQVLNAGENNYVFYGTRTYSINNNLTFTGTTVFEAGTVLKYKKSGSGYAITLDGINCKTEPFLPAIITSGSDTSVGENVIPGTGVDAAVALKFNGTDPIEIKNIVFRYATRALEFAGQQAVLQNVQFYKCKTAIGASTGNSVINVRNALMVGYDFNSGDSITTQVFGGNGGSTINGENLTIDGFDNLYNNAITTLNLVNSIVTRIGSPNYNGFNTSSSLNYFSSTATVFTSNGTRGAYYLADDSLRNSGTDQISVTGLAELRKMTTHAPLPLASDITADAVLSPRAPLDTGAVDKGYHYFPVDYYTSGTALSAKLTLTNGVSVAHFAPISMRAGSKVISCGSPERLNRILRSANVQDMAEPFGGTVGGFIQLDSANGQYDNEINLRFTEIAYMASLSGVPLVEGFNGFGRRLSPLAISDSILRGVGLQFYSNESGNVISLLNNVFMNGWVRFEQGPAMYNPYAPMGVSLYNNLFHTGCTNTFVFNNSSTGPLTWTIKDNFFNSASFYAQAGYSLPAVSRNAYRTGIDQTYWIAHTGTNNVVGVTADFVPGPLGSFYYPPSGAFPSSASLRNIGSRSANDAGLHHFTTSSDGLKEAGTVDIGFHYPTVRPPDSGVVGFNGNQGPLWKYQRTSTSGQPAVEQIVNLPTFNSGSQFWEDAATPWLRIASIWQIPGSAEDSLRTYIAPQSGLVSVTGSAYDGQNGGAGNLGAKAEITVNRTVVVPWTTIPEGSTASTAVTMVTHPIMVTAGDEISFRVNAIGSNDSDYVYWNPVISYLTPLDGDNDGLPDYLEDTNGNGGAYEPSVDLSNWQASDTDGDQMPDGWELTYGTDVRMADGALDRDGDGNTNIREVHRTLKAQVHATKPMAYEGGQPAEFIITVPPAYSRNNPVVVSIATSGGSYRYSASPALGPQVSFGIGETLKRFAVTALSDNIANSPPQVSLSVTITGAVGIGSLPIDATPASVMIVDDDRLPGRLPAGYFPEISVAAVDTLASEGNALDVGGVEFRRTSPGLSTYVPNFPLEIGFGLAGEATEGIDYILRVGLTDLPLGTRILTIPAGQNAVTLQIVAVNDSNPEFLETVKVRAIERPSYRISSAEAAVDIDDSPLQIRYGTAFRRRSGSFEGAQPIVTFWRTGPVSTGPDVRVDLGLDPSPPDDEVYNSSQGEVRLFNTPTFPPGDVSWFPGNFYFHFLTAGRGNYATFRVHVPEYSTKVVTMSSPYGSDAFEVYNFYTSGTVTSATTPWAGLTASYSSSYAAPGQPITLTITRPMGNEGPIGPTIPHVSTLPTTFYLGFEGTASYSVSGTGFTLENVFYPYSDRIKKVTWLGGGSSIQITISTPGSQDGLPKGLLVSLIDTDPPEILPIPLGENNPTTPPFTPTLRKALVMKASSNAPNDPLDSDGDGWMDQLEIDAGANPLASDSDGDGMNDYVENFILGTAFAAANAWGDLNDDRVFDLAQFGLFFADSDASLEFTALRNDFAEIIRGTNPSSSGGGDIIPPTISITQSPTMTLIRSTPSN